MTPLLGSGPLRSWLLALALVPAAAAASALTGCTPKIGDSCALSTDCASDGTRVCDTAEPGGYCTVLNCTGNNLGSTCPDNAFCVLFNPNVPGCPFSAQSPGRIGQSECRNSCQSDSDCRASYLCASPLAEPWSSQILDPNQTLKACLPALGFVDGGIGHTNYGYTGAPDAVPPVCQAAGPTFDAGFPPVDAGVDAAEGGLVDAGSRDGGSRDAHPESSADAAPLDAAADAAADGATKDAGPRDAGTKDAGKDATPRDAGKDAAPKDAGHDVPPG